MSIKTHITAMLLIKLYIYINGKKYHTCLKTDFRIVISVSNMI